MHILAFIASLHYIKILQTSVLGCFTAFYIKKLMQTSPPLIHVRMTCTNLHLYNHVQCVQDCTYLSKQSKKIAQEYSLKAGVVTVNNSKYRLLVFSYKPGGVSVGLGNIGEIMGLPLWRRISRVYRTTLYKTSYHCYEALGEYGPISVRSGSNFQLPKNNIHSLI